MVIHVPPTQVNLVFTLSLASYWIFSVNCDPDVIISFVSFFTPNKLFIP